MDVPVSSWPRACRLAPSWACWVIRRFRSLSIPTATSLRRLSAMQPTRSTGCSPARTHARTRGSFRWRPLPTSLLPACLPPISPACLCLFPVPKVRSRLSASCRPPVCAPAGMRPDLVNRSPPSDTTPLTCLGLVRHSRGTTLAVQRSSWARQRPTCSDVGRTMNWSRFVQAALTVD